MSKEIHKLWLELAEAIEDVALAEQKVYKAEQAWKEAEKIAELALEEGLRQCNALREEIKALKEKLCQSELSR